MHPKLSRLAVLLALPLLVAGCEAQKSSNPLSPTVAGPISGVNITAPRMIEPSSGAEILKDQQPITLTVENATSSGVRPLTYLFEIATDPDFNNKVFTRDGVAPGDGRTSTRLSGSLDADRAYYWRARAQDGANTGPFAATTTFSVRTPVRFEAPALVSPVGGARIPALPPVFLFRNANRTGPAGSVSYTLQVSKNDSFTAIVADVTVGEQGGQTAFTLNQGLDFDRLYYWRVRAFDDKNTGAWSATQTFRTPTDPTPAPPPGPPPPPPPTPGGSCALNNGPAIIQCISAKYASYRAPVGSFEQRQANMVFLRDRIIEAGKCGGLEYGWNLKRGGPELSIDVIAWKRSDGNMGVDIAYDYDNYGRELILTWTEIDLFAAFKAYPSVSCNGV